MMLYEYAPYALRSLVQLSRAPDPSAGPAATLRLRKKDEPLTPWYHRQISDNHLLREDSRGPGICASCGGGTWMELYGQPACHDCVDRLRFAGYPLGFREAVKRGDPLCQPR